MELLCDIPALRTLKDYDCCLEGWKEAEGLVGKRTRAVTKKGEQESGLLRPQAPLDGE